ncbi:MULTISPECIES: LysR family transcriptional regulator [Ramlibacter]|uniref:LysR family transcriptional regulator n=1 Tax=Ramlibacter pinisoli TaxID=2682844 RepID=A0A6N8IVX4_9BURK|nr:MULTISPECIES: LysR family transcriptional regulator [Ramlibacter]MBA2961032.1 LysR family transcriptional regulator [Ramlibacter sp. CGMCC 1.13660]MVQ30977.1 LysR family transcriptional regulator [Ramlibacter pinisoli]
MNTRQLRHFLAVMDLGSLSAAAQQVHLSLPALSRSLRALEDSLGIPLFDREGRGLAPTPYAQLYAQRARRIVFDEKEAAREVRLMQAGELGPLAFGMGSSLAHGLLAPMVLQLLATAPNLRLRTMVQSSDVLLEALAREQIDFFVGDVRVAEQDADMAVEPLHQCSFGWFVRTGHPLAGRRRLRIADLLAYPCVLPGFAEEGMLRRLARLYGLSLPLEDHFAVNSNDMATVHALLAASDAILPSTHISAVLEVAAGRLQALDVDPPLDLELTLGMVRRDGRTLPPSAERAFAIVRRYFEDAQRAIAQHA